MSDTCACNGNCANKTTTPGSSSSNLGLGLGIGSLIAGMMGLFNSDNNSNKPFEVKALCEAAILSGIDVDRELYLDIVDRIYDGKNQTMPDLSGIVSDLMGKFDVSKLFDGMVKESDKIVKEETQTDCDNDLEEDYSESEFEETEEYESEEIEI